MGSGHGFVVQYILCLFYSHSCTRAYLDLVRNRNLQPYPGPPTVGPTSELLPGRPQ
jgi:hypothetical protein